MDEITKREALANNASKPGDKVFLKVNNNSIREYTVTGTTFNSYTLKNEFKNRQFDVLKHKVFLTKEDAKFSTFSEYCFDCLKVSQERLFKYLNKTTKTEYVERFKKEYSEYLI